jgi:hypothetical protein
MLAKVDFWVKSSKKDEYFRLAPKNKQNDHKSYCKILMTNGNLFSTQKKLILYCGSNL